MFLKKLSTLRRFFKERLGSSVYFTFIHGEYEHRVFTKIWGRAGERSRCKYNWMLFILLTSNSLISRAIWEKYAFVSFSKTLKLQF